MRINNIVEIVGEDPKQTKEQIERKLRNYKKFQAKVTRLTEFAHVKRMMARMEYQKNKEEEDRKNAAAKKKTVV